MFYLSICYEYIQLYILVNSEIIYKPYYEL